MTSTIEVAPGAGSTALRARFLFDTRRTPAILPCLRRIGHPEGVDSEATPPGRRREIDARLDAVRARLKALRERDLDARKRWTATPNERVAAAQRHAAEAYDAALHVLASSVQAFRRAAEAHEHAASMHESTAAAGIGDVRGHERQATLHRAAAAADHQRAERALSLLSDYERTASAADGGSGPAADGRPGPLPGRT